MSGTKEGRFGRLSLGLFVVVVLLAAFGLKPSLMGQAAGNAGGCGDVERLQVDQQEVLSVPAAQAACGSLPVPSMNRIEVSPCGMGAHELCDTENIQAAVDALPAGGIVLFTGGTYHLALARACGTDPADARWRHSVRVKSNVYFVGADPRNPPILRLRDNQGDFGALFSNVSTNCGWEAPVNNVWFANLIFDGNKVNNPAYGDLLGGPGRRAIYILSTASSTALPQSSFGVLGSEFRDFLSTHLIYIGGNSKDVCIHDNKFSNNWGCRLFESSEPAVIDCADATKDGQICDLGGSAYECRDADHSTVYIDGKGVAIKNNTFELSQIALPGGRSAIETHGEDFDVSHNRMSNYFKGLNVTNISAFNHATPDGQTISDNVITGSAIGVHLWSRYSCDRSQPEPCSGYDLLTAVDRFNLSIHDNLISLDPVAWREGGLRTDSPGAKTEIRGIMIDRATAGVDDTWRTAPYGDVRIYGNQIRYPPKGPNIPDWLDGSDTMKSPEWYSAGIQFNHKNGLFEHLEIRGNRVLNALANSLYLNTNIRDGNSCQPCGLNIRDNDFANPGTSHFFDTESLDGVSNENSGLMSAIYVTGGTTALGLIPGIEIENNCFLDLQTPRTISKGITANDSGCLDCTASGNYYELTDIAAGPVLTDRLRPLADWGVVEMVSGCPRSPNSSSP